METFLNEIGWTIPDGMTLARVAGRLFSAVILGALIGWEREVRKRAAGLRTHMLVALGSALFTLVPIECGFADVSQIVRGIAPGIGFLGAGAILKLTAEREIEGLTTAASIWLTAAAGLAVGAGQFWAATIAVVLSLGVLIVVKQVE